MINTIKKAIDRIVWRTSNGWKCNENDVEAINFIIDYVNNQNKSKDYQLFAKLYIFLYQELLKHYNTTIFDNIPVRRLSEILETPTEVLIDNFKRELNNSELYELCDKLGLSDKHPATRTNEEKEKDSKILDNVLQNEEHLNVFIKEIWDYETVEKNLTNQINNVINLYDK